MAEDISTERQPITHERFLEVARAAHCRTLSTGARPTQNEAAYQYECPLAELIKQPVYPVLYVNEAKTEFRRYDDPEARPIRVAELAGFRSLMSLIQSELDKWYRPDMGELATASLIILRCLGCNRRVLIDGVHRVLWLFSHGKDATIVQVTELAGARWPADTPDFNVVCECARDDR